LFVFAGFSLLFITCLYSKLSSDSLEYKYDPWISSGHRRGSNYCPFIYSLPTY